MNTNSYDVPFLRDVFRTDDRTLSLTSSVNGQAVIKTTYCSRLTGERATLEHTIEDFILSADNYESNKFEHLLSSLISHLSQRSRKKIADQVSS